MVAIGLWEIEVVNIWLNIKYKIQAKPEGIAQAFLIAEEFIKNSSVTLILGDNLFHGDFLVNQLQKSLGPAGGQNHKDANDPVWGKFIGEGAFGQVFVNDNDRLAYKISISSSDIDKQRFEKEVERLKAIDQWHDIPKEKLPELSKFEGRSIIAMKTLPVLGVRCYLQQYLDFSINRNSMIISKNVIYSNTENILNADVIEINIKTKDTKIFMHEKKHKVNIQSKN